MIVIELLAHTVLAQDNLSVTTPDNYYKTTGLSFHRNPWKYSELLTSLDPLHTLLSEAYYGLKLIFQHCCTSPLMRILCESTLQIL